jgi:ribulose-phosphate 3-epimerase
MSTPRPVLERLRTVAPTISVGLLTADLTAIGTAVRLLESCGVQLLHFDVMDGCFCPQLTFGPPLIKAIRTSLLKDVHLVIEDPLEKLAAYAAAGADMITVHVEACRHPHRVLQAIGGLTNANDPDRGIARGIALNPGTPVEVLEPLIDEVDLIVLLAVNPGWSGQKYIPASARRLKRLLDLVRQSRHDILLGLDGGITRENVADVARTGADIFVTGSAVFDGKSPEGNARQMLAAIVEARKV